MKKNLFKSLTGTLLALTLTLGIGTVAFAGQAQGTSTGHTFGDNDWKAYAYSGTGSVVFCQVLFPEKSVGIPFFQQGIFPAFSGHYASLRMRACSIR